MNNSEFHVNWSSHPGQTVMGILDLRRLSPKEASALSGIPYKELMLVLKGRRAIDDSMAQALEIVVGGSAKFWIKRQTQYESDCATISKRKNEAVEWLTSLPTSDMIKNGWIDVSNSSLESKLKACLEFFRATSIESWYQQNNAVLATTAFRISNSFDSTPESIITWIQQGKNESNSIECAEWNKEKFYQSLWDARKLSRTRSPSIFIPKLQELFAQNGVALVIVKAPKCCRASGAVLSHKNKKLMILSFRHLTDDHFWFSLFHEAGHLVLHDTDNLILEYQNEEASIIEEEANRFSQSVLIPEHLDPELSSLTEANWKAIVRFAKKAGVSPGIIVGQLQNRGKVRHGKLEKLKVRYRWV